MPKQLASIQDLPRRQLYLHADALLMQLDPNRLRPLPREARKQVWYELKECLREMRLRGDQLRLY